MSDANLNRKIMRTWDSVCAAYPEACTPFVAREVARICRVSIDRVFQAI